MTIYTSASRTHKARYGICEEGIVRTQNTLAKFGLTMKSVVTMRLILDELGISDCLFSFCEVEPGCEKEAEIVLHDYMGYVLDLTAEYLGVSIASKAIAKRMQGYIRPMALAEVYNAVNEQYQQEPDPVRRKGLDVYRSMASERPNYLVALHAGIALLDGAQMLGKRDEVHSKLHNRLAQLMPAE